MPDRDMTTPAVQPVPPVSLVHPLEDFYAATGQPLPPFGPMEGEAMPEPYRSLLVHQRDMTPTLEKFYKCRLHLQVLGRRRKEDWYFREVVLVPDGGAQAVEFGAIKINLALFAPAAREKILQEQVPLGHILEADGIAHASRPSAYLRLASDKLINEFLGLTGAQVLYGRRNTLFDPQQRSLAEIVEILPPVRPPANA